MEFRVREKKNKKKEEERQKKEKEKKFSFATIKMHRKACMRRSYSFLEQHEDNKKGSNQHRV